MLDNPTTRAECLATVVRILIVHMCKSNEERGYVIAVLSRIVRIVEVRYRVLPVLHPHPCCLPLSALLLCRDCMTGRVSV
jgi:hypothetical protein